MGRRKLKPVLKSPTPSAKKVLKRFGVKPSDSTPRAPDKKKGVGTLPGLTSKPVSIPLPSEPQGSVQEASARGSIVESLGSPYVLESYSPSVSQTLGEDDSSSDSKDEIQSVKAHKAKTSESSSGIKAGEDNMLLCTGSHSGAENQNGPINETSEKIPDGPAGVLNSASKEVPTAQAKSAGAWVGLFKDNKQQHRGLPLPAFEIQGNRAVLEMQDMDEMEKTWGFCLVGFVAGKFPGKEAILSLCDSWNVKYEYLAHTSGWLVFKFPTSEIRDEVLQNGPYSIFGRPLLLKVMPSDFDFDAKIPLSIPVWISLPNLPLNCWNARALGKIASILGNPISTDRLTATRERISFARVLVEIDPSKELKRMVEIQLPNGRIRQQKIIYENEPKYCSMCKVLGHSVAVCKRAGSISQGRASAGLKIAVIGAKVMDGVPGPTDPRVEGQSHKMGPSVSEIQAPTPADPVAEIIGEEAEQEVRKKGNDMVVENQHDDVSSNREKALNGEFQTVRYRKQKSIAAVSHQDEGLNKQREEQAGESLLTKSGEPKGKGVQPQKSAISMKKERLKGVALPGH